MSGSSGTGAGPLNFAWCLGGGRHGRDSRKRYLGISSEFNCSQYLLMLLQVGGKGAPRTTLPLSKTVLFAFWFSGGLMYWALGLRLRLSGRSEGFFIAEVQTGDPDTTVVPTPTEPSALPCNEYNIAEMGIVQS